MARWSLANASIAVLMLSAAGATVAAAALAGGCAAGMAGRYAGIP
jgi:hypothetical protein